MPRGNWNQAVIDSDEELEPVLNILVVMWSVCRTAQRLLESSKAEYQHLRNLEWSEDTPQAQRFYWLRWQREALANFVAQAGSAADNLQTETQNVWNSKDIAEIDALEDARAYNCTEVVSEEVVSDYGSDAT